MGILKYSLMALMISVSAFSMDDIEYERANTYGSSLVPIVDENQIQPEQAKDPVDQIDLAAKQYMETGMYTSSEFEYDASSIETRKLKPGVDTSMPKAEELSAAQKEKAASSICPARPLELWDGKVKKLVCKKEVIESNKNLKEEQKYKNIQVRSVDPSKYHADIQPTQE